MAQRSWLVRPDTTVQGIGEDGAPVEIEAVSKHALAEAVMDGVIGMHRFGGYLSVVPVRRPTGLPNEMVTVAAFVEWKDRTDDARPQPEQQLDLDTASPGADHGEIEEAEPFIGDGGAVQHAEERAAVSVGAADVDESRVPEHLRGV